MSFPSISVRGLITHGKETPSLAVQRLDMLTHVERTSLYTVVHLVPSGEADAIYALLRKERVFAGATITYDRGSELALWKLIEKATGSSIFFADAHSPWQRPKNENTNGRLRRVFPKRYDFSTLTDKDIKRTVYLMNHTKRKSLLWRTPCEVYGRCCGSGGIALLFCV